MHEVHLLWRRNRVPAKTILSTLRLRLTVIIKYNKLNNIAKREGAKDVREYLQNRYYPHSDSGSQKISDKIMEEQLIKIKKKHGTYVPILVKAK